MLGGSGASAAWAPPAAKLLTPANTAAAMAPTATRLATAAIEVVARSVDFAGISGSSGWQPVAAALAGEIGQQARIEFGIG